jgi:hypothetical protein
VCSYNHPCSPLNETPTPLGNHGPHVPVALDALPPCNLAYALPVILGRAMAQALKHLNRLSVFVRLGITFALGTWLQGGARLTGGHRRIHSRVCREILYSERRSYLMHPTRSRKGPYDSPLASDELGDLRGLLAGPWRRVSMTVVALAIPPSRRRQHHGRQRPSAPVTGVP